MTEKQNAYKMRQVSTFEDVLTNGDDQVLVREILKMHVPLDAQKKIMDKFNAYVERYNAKHSS